jgi:lysyl-tRNA synthetase class 2
MRFIIAPEIFQRFPGTIIGVVAAHDINNSIQNPAVAELLETTQKELKRELTSDMLQPHPHIAPWLEAYKSFGAKPKEYPPSVLNLAQRTLKTGIKSINPLVDLYNVISLKYLLPAGGEDLDTINGDIQLTIAGDNEPATLLLGDKEPKVPVAGEVLYKDTVGAICRRWNWREADRTKLTQNTKHAFLVLEALPPVSKEIMGAALNELAMLVQKYCGGTVTVALLDAQHPEIAVKKGTSYANLNLPHAVTQTFDIYNKKIDQAIHGIAGHDSDEHHIRTEKVDRMRAQQQEPWPGYQEVTATCTQVIQDFKEGEQTVYAVAGRLMSLRGHGKTIFGHIQDRTGRLQVYIREDAIPAAAFKFFNDFVDVGDYVWVHGYVFKTKMGEISLHVDDISLLSKCLHPLPEKFHGIADVEVRYRQRYLDLISSPEHREKFKRRSKIVQVMRDYLNAHDFIEVETPMLHPIPGGAAARPFITHHNALSNDFYLRIAPELYLKRLVVGGFERVYEINRNFRNEGVSTRHNPEFTMLEFYMAHKDYHFIMGFVEEMLKKIVHESCGANKIPYGDHVLDFESPFKRLSMLDAVAQYAGCSAADLHGDLINKQIEKHKIKLHTKDPAWGYKLVALFEELVEKNLIQPTFIMDFPIEISPLAKRDAQNPTIAARFELFIGGMELSNGFNELNDPFDQAERFKDQVKAQKAGDAEAHHYDADYVLALEHGLPPTVGVGIGIDRLVMFLTNTTSIKDVILFPTLKKKDH